MVFLVQGSHGSRGWWNHIVNEEKEGILWSQMDPLSDQEVELSNSQVRGNQVLLLVQVSNPCFGSLFNDHLQWIKCVIRMIVMVNTDWDPLGIISMSLNAITIN